MENKESLHTYPISIYEKVFIWILLFFSTSQGGIPLFSTFRAVDPLHGDPVVQIIWSFFYMVSTVILFRKVNILEYIIDNPLIFILIGYAIISIFWSSVPQLTLRRAIALFGTTIVSVYLAYRLNIKSMQTYLFWVLLSTALFSFLALLILPEYAIQPKLNEFAWRGIYGHKNHFGRIMFFLAILSFILLQSSKGKTRVIFLLGMIISLFSLYFSRSMTSFIVMCLTICVYIFLKLKQKQNYLSVSLLMILCGVIITAFIDAYFYIGFDEIFKSILGKDITLTGRTYLWQMIWHQIFSAFWIGHGYTGFWTSLNSTCLLIWYYFGANVTHAHNGILNLWLDLGIFGVLLFVLISIQFVIRIYYWIKNDADFNEYIFPIIFFITFFIINITESMVLSRNYFFWIIFVALSFIIKRNLRDTSNKC